MKTPHRPLLVPGWTPLYPQLYLDVSFQRIPFGYYGRSFGSALSTWWRHLSLPWDDISRSLATSAHRYRSAPSRESPIRTAKNSLETFQQRQELKRKTSPAGADSEIEKHPEPGAGTGPAPPQPSPSSTADPVSRSTAFDSPLSRSRHHSGKLRRMAAISAQPAVALAHLNGSARGDSRKGL